MAYQKRLSPRHLNKILVYGPLTIFLMEGETIGPDNFFFSQRGRRQRITGYVVGERRERRAGGGFGAVRRDLGPRAGKSRGCAGRTTPGAKQRWSRTHQESGVIFAVPGFCRPLGLSLSHCGKGRLPSCVPASHGRDTLPPSPSPPPTPTSFRIVNPSIIPPPSTWNTVMDSRRKATDTSMATRGSM